MNKMLKWIVCLGLGGGTGLGSPERVDLSVNSKNADLPPLLHFCDGREVEHHDQWKLRRQEIRQLMIQTFTGDFPRQNPEIIKAEVIQEHKKPDGSVRKEVCVTLDTPGQLSIRMWLWIPHGSGLFPVLLTAPRFYQIGWAEEALSRGYLVCLYPGVDSHHQEKDYPGYESLWQSFQETYPEATWTEIAVKAWLAGRCLDYLFDPQFDYPVAPKQVAVIGFSRYGKQALIAAAFDERITAVVARSSGAGGSAPYHFNGREGFGEASCDFAGQWFLESLRSYVGRENELPIDSHGWLALIAPRHCLLDTAYNDDGDPTFACERAYLQGRQVYRLLGCPENLCLDYRPGGHETEPFPNYITPQRYRRNIDWFDLAFGRWHVGQAQFSEKLIHHFNWQAWRDQQRPEDIRLPDSIKTISDENERRRQIICWMLGETSQGAEGAISCRFYTDEEDRQMGHDRWRVDNTARLRVSFGDGVPGNLYFNSTVKTPVPAVIWLHPFSYGSGYNEGYGVEGTTIYHALAREGYVVLAYDQCGFGLRLLEGRNFYQQYPYGSKLGRMVYDVHSAVDFLIDGKGSVQGEMPDIDRSRIIVLGYALGGMVALHAAALDRRISGVVSFSGFTPWRTDTDAKPTGGIRRWWQWHALLPKLGLYHNREGEIPYDYEDVLALIAPRPCLIVSPTRDRHADYEDIQRCMAVACTAWQEMGQSKNLTHRCPNNINRFQADQQNMVIDWLRTLINK